MMVDSMHYGPCQVEAARPSSTEQLAQLGHALLQSLTEHGFGTELWTLKRVGTLIKQMYGAEFGQTQVWRILGALGFSAQKPERRAIERDKQAVRKWKQHT